MEALRLKEDIALPCENADDIVGALSEALLDSPKLEGMSAKAQGAVFELVAAVACAIQKKKGAAPTFNEILPSLGSLSNLWRTLKMNEAWGIPGFQEAIRVYGLEPAVRPPKSKARQYDANSLVHIKRLVAALRDLQERKKLAELPASA